MPAIILENANKSYGAGSPNAVSNLDLEIANGEFMCLLGPSGCGKTTTLRMIAGLENLSGGEIRIGERVVDSISKGLFVGPEKRELGLVFQSYALWPHLTIERNTDFGLRLRKVPKAEREALVTRVMKALDIEKYRGRYPSQLSGGQQQRVALARMLVVNPGVLLLDEPLSNLDARLRLEMRAELKRIHAEFGTTIVFVTHDQWEAMTLATTIAVMNEGSLQQMGTPNDIYDRPANRFVAEFVGSPPINIFEIGAASHDVVGRHAVTFLTARLGPDADIGSLGLRPETIQIADSADAVPLGNFADEAVVTGILPTGGSWIVELTSGGKKTFATANEAPRHKVGDTIWFHVRPAALHVFSRDGQRLQRADDVLAQTAVQ
ncbi:ABC transporter ATP-binding protein [Bosea sp. 2YAB26]|jgi:iron(III) transport system ATP-binding protein|uniref:ABC transporter ATP-binding protein n=1 Tax=Bosea sp. 2YAB26 TaxID=3237478 RepID=UPI003F909295